MTNELILDNARIILRDEVLDGHILVRDGTIAAIDTGRCRSPAARDLDGDFLTPGLVDVHTDNAELHLLPRPGVRWPTRPGVLAHDAAIATAGITTVLDAIACGSDHGKEWRKDIASETVNAISELQRSGHFRADHLLHLRCEIVAEDMAESFTRTVDNPLVRLVSIMDHTPGARQFVDIDKFKLYYRGKHGLDDQQMDEMILTRQRLRAGIAPQQQQLVADTCLSRNITLATHDDATLEHVLEAVRLGARLSEFPTSIEAADSAHQHGLGTIMGAPNLVRGSSHSGNVSARDLAKLGLLDMLTSDYIPASLMQAAWILHSHLGFSLPVAFDTVAGRPAAALGLHDRGQIGVGLRADLVRVHPSIHGPVIRRVWRTGLEIA